MMTTPASAIKDEVSELIEDQIATFGQPSRLTPSELAECHYRAEKIKPWSGARSDRQNCNFGEAVRQGSLTSCIKMGVQEYKRTALFSTNYSFSRAVAAKRLMLSP